jgi:hypothetical protein
VHVAVEHFPATAPGSLLQSPVQQSCAVVHVLPSATHAAAHLNVPCASGTHGFPQQSASVAQVVPTGGFTEQSPT